MDPTQTLRVQVQNDEDSGFLYRLLLLWFGPSTPDLSTWTLWEERRTAKKFSYNNPDPMLLTLYTCIYI